MALASERLAGQENTLRRSVSESNETRAFLADRAPSKITIATWNLEWFFDADTSNNRSDIAKQQSSISREEWDWKLYTTAAAIAQFKPTILAVQEIEDRAVMQSLAKALKDKHQLNYRVAFIEGFDGSTEQDVAILFQSGLVSYSRREQNNAMFTSNEFYNLSKHLIAQFEWNIDGRTESLTLMNMHLRATADAADLRRKQCKLAHTWLQKSIAAGDNVILLGDLNVEETAGAIRPDGDGMYYLTGKHTPDPMDDLNDVLENLPAQEQRTHLVLDKQFDRFLLSNSMMRKNGAGLLFEKIEVLKQFNVRGKEPDLDHFDTRWTKDRSERDISDHHPVMITLSTQAN